MPESSVAAVSVSVTDREGEVHDLEAGADVTLMEVLRDAGMVEAVCGGAMACGTCMVELGQSWAERVPDASDDERALLDGIEAGKGVHARLSCQISLEDHLDGIDIRVVESSL